VLPYAARLESLPAYLQQLEMESNGKRVDRAGREVDYATAPVLWGAEGTVSQHSFHQLLHQGTQVVPADFIDVGEDEILSANLQAQADALAYGTDSLPRVDKIVGPGNAYVNEAKLLVSRDVAIDLPAGPSEVVVVLGRGGDRRHAELELAAQAEHGPDAVCAIVDGDDLEAALAEVERLAPEHVALLGEAESLAPRIRNAGAVFVGASSPVPTGDLGTGANHVLPTGGWARSTGGLGLETFLKPVTVQRLTPAGLALVRPTVEALAAVEGLPAHAAAVAR